MDAIVVKDLKFTWDKASVPILNIDHFKVKQKSSLFLQGPSGSGKSTLLSLLSGILVPQSGSIEILGQAINQLNGKERDKFRANHIGYIFQMFNLLPYLNVVENVVLPCYFSKGRAKRIGTTDKEFEDEAIRLLHSVGLADKTTLNKKSTELSLGQQQRVAACRALIGSPEILIADEPTSALDAHAQLDFLHLLKQECLKNNTTLIFVSHDDRLASNFDQVAQLDNGTLNFLHLEELPRK